MSIDTKPKWTRQQWRNFIDTRDIDLSRPYSEYCLIGIEPSVQVNLQPNVPAPVVADQLPADQEDPEDQVDQEDNQDGAEIKEEVQQPPPKPTVAKPKKAAPAPGFFGALVGGCANVFGEESSGDDSPPALPVAGLSVPGTKKVPYQKAGFTNLATATRVHSGTPDNSWIQTLFISIQQTKRKPLPRRNSPLVRPWTLLLITLLFARYQDSV